ncbi:MAG: 3-oxoacyl-ACP reductase FabG [Gammaproteobacteria bacterium]|nr:3-oxoacyl-ACP reductase FabG [Gammaproteobacteria bacterium]
MNPVLKDKIAIVTGATRGIGKAIAEHLAEMGATIIGTATSSAGVQAIEENFKEKKIKGSAYVLNLSDPEAIPVFYETVKKAVGIPLILINNAGITRDNLFLRMKSEEWDAVINTNLNGVYHLTRACIREMVRAQWGRIVSLSSIVGVAGAAGQANYAAAKAGLIGFSKALAQEVASRNITVNVIAPGYIETDMTNQLPEAVRHGIIDKIPMGRCGSPEEVAFAAGCLVMPQATYITGQTLHVNGGLYMA